MGFNSGFKGLNKHVSLGLTQSISLSLSLSLSLNAVSIQTKFYFICNRGGTVCFEEYWWLCTTSLQASIKIFFSSINIWRLILRCAHRHMKVPESVQMWNMSAECFESKYSLLIKTSLTFKVRGFKASLLVVPPNRILFFWGGGGGIEILKLQTSTKQTCFPLHITQNYEVKTVWKRIKFYIDSTFINKVPNFSNETKLSP